jgi:hypothetical protein
MHTCTCHTEGCGNAGFPVDLQLDSEMDGETFYTTDVYCGACGEQITDITPPAGPPREEVTPNAGRS